MITNKTTLVGIIGWPLGHSLSPDMHNAGFTHLKLDYAYVPLSVHTGNLAAAIAGLKVLGFRGANVTIPHKEAVIEHLDELDASAMEIGAVNTIVFDDGRSIGYNTDAEGFIYSLYAANVPIADNTAILLGAGGAARAVVAGLLDNGISKVIVGARDIDKVTKFVHQFSGNKVIPCDWQSQQFEQLLSTGEIIINSTPLGMYPEISSAPPVNWQAVNKKAVAYDLVYNPLQTTFLKTAAAHGIRTISGEGMLVAQGAIAFELWTGERAPFKVMHAKILELLTKS